MTVNDAEVLDVHPFVVTLYVIVVAPAAMPDTTPVALTVANAVLAEDHTPPEVVFVKIAVEPTQTFDAPEIEATTGNGLTVIAVTDDVTEHPAALVTVTKYEPLAATVIDCVGAPLDHKYDEPAFAVNTTEPPAQKVVGPATLMDAEAPAFTIIAAVADDVHPLAFVTLYVIVEEPAAIPVTTPVVLTVATVLLLEDHVPPVVELANVVDNPVHTFVAPVIEATTGAGFTVTGVTDDVTEQPAAFVTVTVYEPLDVTAIDCVCNPLDHK